MKYHFSVVAQDAAKEFAEKAKEIESTTDPIPFLGNAVPLPIPAESEELILHRSYVVTSIIMSFTYLESFINEFWFEAIDPSHSFEYKIRAGRIPDGIDECTLDRMAVMWSDIERTPVLDKYKKVISIISHPTNQLPNEAKDCNESAKPILDPSKEPFQSVTNLKEFRDYLVHFKVAWHEIKRGGQIEQQLQNWLRLKETEMNPLVPATAPFFPWRCLSASLAIKWSSRADEFTELFCETVKIPRSRVVTTWDKVPPPWVHDISSQ